jgi:hypothetical protein
MRRALGLTLVLALLGACFPGDPALEDNPVVKADFPPTSEPGSVQTATLEIENPADEDIQALVVTFALLGDPDLPAPLVGPSSVGGTSVVSIDPEPRATSEDGAVFTFGRLGAGESTTIEFRIEVPREPGPAANSVSVADGSDVERASGVRIETRVER